tara:strand:+ start:678 stop:1142 length:465 start_codon:yes stop_codon:yes gene_type:complete
MAALQVVGTMISMKAQMDAGRAEKRQAEAQAADALIAGRRSALQYRQKGLEALISTRERIATGIARAAAGGTDAFSGSTLSLATYDTGVGVENFYVTQENSEMAVNAGILQQQQLIAAGNSAMRQARMGALTTGISGFMEASRTASNAGGSWTK